MINLAILQEEIKNITDDLEKKKREYRKAKEDNLKEKYGENFGCTNCAYSCCVNVESDHTCCVQGNCIYCKEYCDEYKPENELSKYIRENHYYDYKIVDSLNSLFDCFDILKTPSLYAKAISILKIIDEK